MLHHYERKTMTDPTPTTDLSESFRRRVELQTATHVRDLVQYAGCGPAENSHDLQMFREHLVDLISARFKMDTKEMGE